MLLASSALVTASCEIYKESDPLMKGRPQFVTASVAPDSQVGKNLLDRNVKAQGSELQHPSAV
jgi:hypothetical protein